MERGAGGRAGRVHGETGPAKPEKLRQAVREAEPLPAAIGIRGGPKIRARTVVAVHDAGKCANAPCVLERTPCHLEKQPELRVHVLSFTWRDPKELGIELRHIGEQPCPVGTGVDERMKEMTTVGLDGIDSTTARTQQLPQLGGGIGAGAPDVHTYHGDVCGRMGRGLGLAPRKGARYVPRV